MVVKWKSKRSKSYTYRASKKHFNFSVNPSVVFQHIKIKDFVSSYVFMYIYLCPFHTSYIFGCYITFCYNFRKCFKGNNVLHYACVSGSLPCIVIVLETGGKLRTPNVDGKTPLDLLPDAKQTVFGNILRQAGMFVYVCGQYMAKGRTVFSESERLFYHW